MVTSRLPASSAFTCFSNRSTMALRSTTFSPFACAYRIDEGRATAATTTSMRRSLARMVRRPIIGAPFVRSRDGWRLAFEVRALAGREGIEHGPDEQHLRLALLRSPGMGRAG